MTRQARISESLSSITGGALVTLGLHILVGNLDRAAAQLRQLLGASAGQALGGIPCVVLAGSQAVRGYFFDQQSFMQGVLRMLAPFWPLLLVILGTILLRDVFTDKVRSLPTFNRYFQQQNSRCRFRCPSFDV